MRLFSLSYFFFLSSIGIGQNTFFSKVDDVEVIENSSMLSSPWMGGINAAQFSTIDVNNDNLEDLFIFDRTGNTISIYINTGSDYIYSSEYADKFPDLQYWALLRDYNQDGKKDIFSYVSGGIGVWLNTSNGSQLSFTQQTFT